ncbi:protein ELFN1 [Alosa pseudoharengus]|uniref:protein ELFN1 n=1 Tax=Alosa pseudoharengus TaxID=34774 RepID=UPI003F8CC763
MHPTAPVEGTRSFPRRSPAGGTQAERRRSLLSWWASAGAVALVLALSWTPGCRGDCWLIEGEKGFVWLAICSQNQPPFESIPLHINSTIVDLRLNENKIRSVLYASLSRFANLTYLNLTKNDISYVEDGAFSALFNLQVLQMGFNRLRNLTEAMLRGLGKLQYLYLQANLIESVSANAFWECQELENVDLSMNRLQVLDGGTFHGLPKLSTCEVYSNPFSCTCELLGFLRWLANFPNRTRERMACDSPPGFHGYSLLSQNPRMPTYRNAFHALKTVCTDDPRSGGPGANTYLFGPGGVGGVGGGGGIPGGGQSRCEECASGSPPPPDEPISTSRMNLGPGLVGGGGGSGSGSGPVMTLKDLSTTLQGHTAVVSVHIPDPFRKMYVLVQYNNSFYTDIQPLKLPREELELSRLRPHTDYTYCVVSVRNALRFNETCLTIPTGPRAVRERLPGESNATHYIMTLLGTLFGMLLALGAAWHCVRRKRREEERSRKLSQMKRSLMELRYGGQAEGGAGGGGDDRGSVHRMPPMEAYQLQLQEVMDTPVRGGGGPSGAPKGNYMEVRREEPIPASQLSQGSVAEISTIAKEVDKVNQIITNCIDALKSESTSFQAPPPPGLVSMATGGDPQLVMSTTSTSAGSDRRCSPSSLSGRAGVFLSPAYKGRSPASRPALQRHHSVEAPPMKRGSASSGGSLRSPRSLRSVATVTPATVIMRASEAERLHAEHHRHSYPGPAHSPPLRSAPLPLDPSHQRGRPAILEPLSIPRQRELAYSQLSPDDYPDYQEGSSSPEMSCGGALGLWERFRFHRKRQRHHQGGDEYLAAGHALRRKVQFARDEDLHDILDYWKGVSAQQKA